MTSNTAKADLGAFDFNECEKALVEQVKDLVKDANHTSYFMKDFHPNTDFGHVIDVVESASKKRIIIVAEIRRTCVSFFHDDGTHFDMKYLSRNSKVLITRNAVQQMERIQVINNGIHTMKNRKLDSQCGFVARHVFNKIGKAKHREFFIGLLKIVNVQHDYADDDDSDNDADDSDIDGSDAADTEEDDHDQVIDDNNDAGHGYSNLLPKFHLSPNSVYLVLVVPRVLMHCQCREDSFYSREDIPFVWITTELMSRVIYNDLAKVNKFIPWKVDRTDDSDDESPTTKAPEYFEDDDYY